MSSEDVVRAFCDAVPRRDAKELAAFFSDDAVYHNIPIAPVTGPAAIEKMLGQFLAPASHAEFEILALAVDGGLVLTERIDRFRVGEKTIELPVMGTFEVAGGKITAWRDYFDMSMYTKQMG